MEGSGGIPGNAEAKPAKLAKLSSDDVKRLAKEEHTCDICREEVPLVGRGMLRCGHVSCSACIHKWFRNVNTCPSCRVIAIDMIETLTEDEISKENNRQQQRANKRGNVIPESNRQKKRATQQMRAIKHHEELNIVTKEVRVKVPPKIKQALARQRVQPPAVGAAVSDQAAGAGSPLPPSPAPAAAAAAAVPAPVPSAAVAGTVPSPPSPPPAVPAPSSAASPGAPEAGVTPIASRTRAATRCRGGGAGT